MSGIWTARITPRWRVALLGAMWVLAAGPAGATGDDGTTVRVTPRALLSAVPELRAGLPEFFKICQDQTYALCAVASCYVYNQVAYCACDIEHGDSISLPFEVDGEDVCDVNANGADNSYMVSLYSVPEEGLAGGDMALYTCPAGSSDGAYAQCDGGFCFTSSAASSFPGFDQPLADNQIICSCPITVADPDSANFGYQIAGPYPCQPDYFENCSSSNTNKKTGTILPVGSPSGAARILSVLLDGPPAPDFNRCPSPRHGG